jgi:hypothetical protein
VRRAGLALAAGLLLLAAGCGGEDEGTAPPPGRFVATSRALTPTAHLFGDPVDARVDVVVDRRRFDPDGIELRINFLPYRLIDGGIRRSRRDFDGFTRVRFEMTLRCLTIACVPSRIASVLGEQEGRGERRTFRFPPARVVYDDPEGGSERHLRRVWWPPLDAISGLSATNPEVQGGGSFNAFTPGAEFKSTLTPVVEPAYRLPPPLLATMLFGAAALVLAFPATLIAREFRRRRPQPEDEPEVAPRERALRLVDWARRDGDAEARREALETLAYELDATGEDEPAREVRALAWASEDPAPESMAELTERLRRVDGAPAQA